jgi:hypothetical protein
VAEWLIQNYLILSTRITNNTTILI